MKIFNGHSASQGIAIGPVFLFQKSELSLQRYRIDDVAYEENRLQIALGQSRLEIQTIYEKSSYEVNAREAEIFQAHESILNDPELYQLTINKIQQDQLNAEAAFYDASEYYANMLESMEDDYFRTRATDVRDISQRLLRILLGMTTDLTFNLYTPSIILVRELTPTDTITIDKKLVLGFCTIEGGVTSHASILARSLGIPAVIGMNEEILSIPNGCECIIDGLAGLLLVEPDEVIKTKYKKQKQSEDKVLEDARLTTKMPAQTVDGHQVRIVANVGNSEGAHAAIDAGAEGVGLLRTEFLYLDRLDPPTEDDQILAYKLILDIFGEMPVVLRTLDIGGDKKLPFVKLPTEMNPFLGVRALRLSLSRPDLFKPQLRALLRAGVGHNIGIMFPMVATVEEFKQAREVLAECKSELEKEGLSYTQNVELGIMVEIPSAAIMADQFAKEVDFFSIGTNDLTQYTLAVDRTNAQLAYLDSAFAPSVLRLIRDVILAAHQEGKWVGLCGELAGEPLAIPILLGLGLDEFSMNPPAIPKAKQIIRSLSQEQAYDISQKALALGNPEEIKEFVKKQLSSRVL